MKKHQSGFTLIEIAIVLVIIGLLLGGVLQGREMIDNSRIKRSVNDTNGIAASIYSYLDRYRALPGDDPAAVARWGIAGIDGDGNGAIDTGQWDTDAADEVSRMWLHLRLSGLVAGQTTDASPGGRDRVLNSTGGVIGVQDGNFGLVGTVTCMGPLDGEFAEVIDFQLDDGDATTGSVRGHTAAAHATNTTAYAIGTPGFLCAQI